MVTSDGQNCYDSNLQQDAQIQIPIESLLYEQCTRVQVDLFDVITCKL